VPLISFAINNASLNSHICPSVSRKGFPASISTLRHYVSSSSIAHWSVVVARATSAFRIGSRIQKSKQAKR
jgi:hypothetical protein